MAGPEMKKTKNLVFLHIPKAAGNSLLDFMLPNYVESERFDVNQGLNYPKRLEELRILPSEIKSSLRLVYGHLPFGVDCWLPGEWDYLTVFRHPVDRIASHFYFVREQPKHYLYEQVMAQDMSLEEYATSGLSGELSNGMTRLLCGDHDIDSLRGHGTCTEEHFGRALNNLQTKFSIVGIVEEMDRSFRLMSKAFNWPLRQVSQKNKTRNRSSLDRLSHSAIQAIESQNQMDLKLYQVAKQKFECLCSDYGVQRQRVGASTGLRHSVWSLLAKAISR